MAKHDFDAGLWDALRSDPRDGPGAGRGSRGAGGAARPRVVVVNAVDLPDSLADIRAQLRTTLNDAVTKHGYDLAPEAGSCADRECLKVAAVSAGASDVLVATGGRNDMRGYHVELRIWNIASDREDNAVAECNICAAQQMVDNVQSAADPLLDRVPTLHANLSATAVPPAVSAGRLRERFRWWRRPTKFGKPRAVTAGSGGR